MKNRFAIWCANFCFFCFVSLFANELDDWSWEGDTSLILSEDQPERLVSLTGELCLHILKRDSEKPELGTYNCWVLRLNPESFEVVLNTPVRAAFQSPESIRSSPNCNELELTGDYEETWLRQHCGQNVTLSGYLWHGHTAHHHTPVLMDSEPWFK